MNLEDNSKNNLEKTLVPYLFQYESKSIHEGIISYMNCTSKFKLGNFEAGMKFPKVNFSIGSRITTVFVENSDEKDTKSFQIVYITSNGDYLTQIYVQPHPYEADDFIANMIPSLILSISYTDIIPNLPSEAILPNWVNPPFVHFDSKKAKEELKLPKYKEPEYAYIEFSAPSNMVKDSDNFCEWVEDTRKKMLKLAEDHSISYTDEDCSAHCIKNVQKFLYTCILNFDVYDSALCKCFRSHVEESGAKLFMRIEQF